MSAFLPALRLFRATPLAAAAYCACAASAQQGGAATLPEVQVQSTRSGDLQTRQLPSYKYTAPLRDTPRSITVIPQALLQEKGATTFEEALRAVPGVAFLGGDAAANPAADRPVIRGFESRNSIMVNGMRDSGMQARESFNVESIAVLKGPNSVYGGRASVGGSIDVVTKSPQLDDFVRASAGAGTARYRRTTADWNRQTGESSAVRLNFMAHDAHVPGRSAVDSRRWGIAPSVAFGLHTPTTVTLGFYHLSTADMPDFSLPFQPGGNKPIAHARSQFYGLHARDFRDSRNDALQLRVEHQLGQGAKLRNTTQWGRATLQYIATNPQFAAPASDNILRLQAKSGKYATNTLSNQTEFSGQAQWGSLHHTWTAGVELTAERSLYEAYLVTDSAGNNIRTSGPCDVPYNCTPLGQWNPRNPWTGSSTLNADMGFPGFGTHTDTNMVSAYLFDTVALSEHWLLSGGLRLERFDVKSRQEGRDDLSHSSNLFSYQLGLLYKPAPALSLYTSLGTAANPPGANSGLGGGSDQITVGNQDLKAEKARNIEVGAKWDVLQERLSLSAALFQSEKTNARVSDGLGGTINAGRQRVRGLELGASGQLGQRWSLFAGYAWQQAITKNAGPGNPAASGLPMTMTPKNSLSVWSSYKARPRLTLAGGVSTTSRAYASVSPTTRRWIPGYARLDMAAIWQINPGMRLQLNLNNALDRKYFQSAYPIYATWGPGRAALLALHVYR